MNEYIVAMRESLVKASRLVSQMENDPRMVSREMKDGVAAALEDAKLFALMSIAESLATLAENVKPPEE